MTEFSCLKDAVNYRTHCPLCKSKMEIDGRYGVDIRKDVSWDFREKTLLTWQQPDEEVTIDLDTETIKSIIKKTSSQVYGPNFSGSVANYFHTPVYNGLMYIRLGMSCDDCCQYSYVVQIIIDIGENHIVGLPLNSETITLEDELITHELRNIYTTNETIYSYFRKYQPAEDGPVGGAPLVFPLIPIDLSDPHKTLDRIRNLIVFS